jgi:hypothetical protein
MIGDYRSIEAQVKANLLERVQAAPFKSFKLSDRARAERLERSVAVKRFDRFGRERSDKLEHLIARLQHCA